MKWLLIWGAVLGGTAGTAWYHKDQWPAALQSAKPGPVKTVSHATLGEETIHATGFVEGSSQTAELRFELMGRLENIFITEGQHVKQGQVLAQLDASLLTQHVAQAAADLELAKAEWARLSNAARPETRQVAQAQVLIAEAELAHLQDEAARTKRLFDKGVASEREWMDAFHPLQIAQTRLAEKQALAAEVEAPARKDDLKVAQSRVEVAQAALTHAKLRLEKSKLLAPYSGTILHLSAEVGELVGPSDLKPLILFANLDRMRVRAYVEELHALSISEGDTIQVTADGLPNQTFAGTVIYRAAWMDQKQYRTHKPNEFLDVRTREILIELEDAKELVIGLPVDLVISPASQTDSQDPPYLPSALDSPITLQPIEHTNEPSGEFPNHRGAPNSVKSSQTKGNSQSDHFIGLGTTSHEHPPFKR